MTHEEAIALVESFPGVESGLSLGSLAFKVKSKLLCRLGARTGPDDLMLIGIGPDEAELLIERDPAVFHTTPHFTDANCVLARIGPAHEGLVRPLLERRWREIAPKWLTRA